ncbi:TPA: phage tail protein [Yersinia enterocolitica]
MHRIDTPTAQTDKFGAGKNGFTRGNPQTGVPATALDDDYFDAIQEEIAGVIESTGTMLNKNNRAQLLAAINTIITNGGAGFLKKNSNLSDLANVQTALTNLGVPSSSLVPIGVPLPYPLATPPTGFLKCNGSSFSAATYPKLALAYPSGVLPDLRGEFLRGWDDGRGVDSGRGLLTVENDEIRSHRHLKLNVDTSGVAYSLAAGHFSEQQTGGFYANTTIGYDSGTPGIGTGATGGLETRPRNIAFNYIVRAI